MTKALFLEMLPFTKDDTHVIFNLTEEDDPETNTLSLYKIYMSFEDETEFQFAKEVFGEFPHWQILCETNFFKPHIERWRRERRLQLLNKTIERIKRIADDPNNKDYYNANKYLIDRMKREIEKETEPAKKEALKGWKEKNSPNMKDQMKINEDYKRIFN